LPKAVKSLGSSTAADYLFPDKLNEDIAPRFGDFKDRVQEVISPIDAVNPTYMEGLEASERPPSPKPNIANPPLIRFITTGESILTLVNVRPGCGLDGV
jgi:hypothetical protein